MKLKKNVEKVLWMLYILTVIMISGVGSLDLCVESVLLIVISIIINLLSFYLLSNYGRVFENACKECTTGKH